MASTGKQEAYKQQKQNEVKQRENEIAQLQKKLKKIPQMASSFKPSGSKYGTTSMPDVNPEYLKIQNQIQSLQKANKGALTGKAYTEGLEKAQKEDLYYDKEGLVKGLESDATATTEKLRADAKAAQDKIDQLTNDPNFDPTSPTNKALLDNLNFFVEQGDAQIKKNDELRKLYGPNYEKAIAEGRAEGLKQSTAAKQQGIADASTLAAIGAKATARQLGVGSPMTLGQQQSLSAANQQMGGQAFQQGQIGAQNINAANNSYIQSLQNQSLDYQKYFADKQMSAGEEYRKLGLAVGKDEAKNKYGLLTGNIREGRDINANIDQFGLNARSGVAAEKANILNQKLGGIDTEWQKRFQDTVQKQSYELGKQQLAQQRDEADTNKWLGIGNLIIGGAGVAAKAYGAK